MKKRLWSIFTWIGYLGVLGMMLFLSYKDYWKQAAGWEIILLGIIIMEVIGLIGVCKSIAKYFSERNS